MLEIPACVRSLLGHARVSTVRKRRFILQSARVAELEVRTLLSLTTIDFEGYPALTRITNQYEKQGVDFAGAWILTGDHLNPAYPPHSGVNVVSDVDYHIQATATDGTDWSEVGGYVTGLYKVTMTAYDAQGNVLGSNSTTGRNTLGSAVPTGPPNEKLDVKAANIAYVNFVGTKIPGHQDFVLDDFFFQTEPDLQLTEATTLDAQSVTVYYSISTSNISSPLTFSVYRSDQTTWDSKAVLIGEQTIDPSTDPQDLTIGNHVVQLIKGTSLPPDPTLPYVIVVANSNNSVLQDPASADMTYFQKYLVGVVVHGYEPLGFINQSTPDWELSVANALQNDDSYDAVIAFNWTFDSSKPSPGLPAADGYKLYSDVVSESDDLASAHSGDVIDLHFIGHSRGAGVVSQALQDLVGTTDLALEGSYIKVTLLDPHPANISTVSLFSAFPLTAPLVLPPYEAVEIADNDPAIVIPKNVMESNVYYQHSSYLDGFVFTDPAEFGLNLWGEGPSDGIINQSGSPIQWHNLSDVVDSTLGPNGKKLGPIGHTEVPEWYLVHVVEVGASLGGGTTTALKLSRAASTSVIVNSILLNADVLPTQSTMPFKHRSKNPSRKMRLRDAVLRINRPQFRPILVVQAAKSPDQE